MNLAEASTSMGFSCSAPGHKDLTIHRANEKPSRLTLDSKITVELRTRSQKMLRRERPLL